MAKKKGAGTRIAIAIVALVVVALLGSIAWTFVRGPGPDAPQRPDPVTNRPVIRVQVLNGSGEGGVGGRIAHGLREGGFHVVEVGNADRQDYFETVVVARREPPDAAEEVARYLGSPPVVRQAHAGPSEYEVTVVLGSDRSRITIDD